MRGVSSIRTGTSNTTEPGSGIWTVRICMFRLAGSAAPRAVTTVPRTAAGGARRGCIGTTLPSPTARMRTRGLRSIPMEATHATSSRSSNRQSKEKEPALKPRLTLALAVACLAGSGAIAHVQAAAPMQAGSTGAASRRVEGGFSTRHRFTIRGHAFTFIQRGSFARRGRDVQYVRGPSVRCGRSGCISFQSLTPRHVCKMHDAAHQCTRLAYLSIIDLGRGRLGYRSNGQDRELFVETDVLSRRGYVSTTYVR
jgi:hypothetical protein